MLSDKLRARISALNRRTLRHPIHTAAPEPAGRSSPKRRRAAASDARLRVPLQDLVEGVEVENECGRCLKVQKDLRDLLGSRADWFSLRYFESIRRTDEAVVRSLNEAFGCLRGIAPEGLIFVDIEATGLTPGVPLFLVGVLSAASGSIELLQLFARSYEEEGAVLRHFFSAFPRQDVVVSFNGKSYDLPYIRDRAFYHGISPSPRLGDIDLLHEARRRWRHALPNCRLQTLERHICRRIRTGDIPGMEIPDAYHRFVRSGNALQIAEILHHNAMDLLTLVELMVVVLEEGEPEA